MDIKQTGRLKVLADVSLSEGEVVINPNDGFDLGLMMTETTVELLLDNGQGSVTVAEEGNLIQKNECTLGTVVLGSRLIEKLDTIDTVYLYIEEQNNNFKLTISR